MKRSSVLLVVAAVMLAAPAARAQILGASNTNFTGFTCPNGNNADGSCQRSAAFPTNTATTFTSRYAWNINADVGVFSTRDSSSAAQHNITFTATAPGGYRLDISTARVGALGRSHDASGCEGSADTSGITGNSNFALGSGTLSLADPGVIGSGGGNANTPYSQSSGAATVFNVSNGVGQGHSLVFTWSGSVRSNSCEASVRQGENSGTTTGCEICGYPGDPGRTQSSDGHVVTVSFTSLCGDGTVDGAVGEECDEGASNGAPTSCCTSTCQFRAAGQQCRASAGECDLAESCSGSAGACPADAKSPNGTPCTADSNPCTLDQCNGSSNTCQHPAGNAGALCRAAAGECDVAENCTGASTTCPADAKQPSGTACTPDSNPCTLDQCNGSSNLCQHPVGNPGALCRPSAGVCDIPETCTGASATCPPEAFASGPLCRPSAGVCDPAESCDGTGPNCPADGKSTAECRASAGDCDVAESCDGVNDDCPPDQLESAGTECRPAAGACDVAEACDGIATACPADSVSGAFVVCRPSAGDCDPAENCDGVNAACPADALEPVTTECRASGGVCDPAESCTGSSAACPADAKSTGECRASAGVCDPAETCDGMNDDCPADAKSTSECRASAGVCDPAESCDGVNDDCPADAKSTAVCRASAGVCDIAESCDGVNDACPLDGLAPTGTVCRPSAGTCDVQEVCTGVIATCPPDITLLDGTPCNDGTSCTGPDTCEAGVCTGEPNADNCADDFLCYKVKAPAIAPMSVSLSDQFESATATVNKLKNLCTPGDKNAEGVFDSTTHEVAYAIRSAIKHVRRTNILVENQIGLDGTGTTGIRLDTTKADMLLVPSNKNLAVDPPAPNINLINVDHYKCYKVKVTPGTPKLVKGITVSVEDQFNNPAKVLTLRKPRHLCLPVDKNAEGIKNPDAHLLCYTVKRASGQPKHVRQSGVHINNQIGVSILGTTKEAELCIPSIKTL